MWVLDEKKFIFVNRVIESHCRPIKENEKNIIRVKFSFKFTELFQVIINQTSFRTKFQKIISLCVRVRVRVRVCVCVCVCVCV